MTDKNYELFNAHQEDVRRRVDSLAKGIFLLAGGTLTLSITTFTNKSTSALNECLSFILKSSWWALFLSIIFVALGLSSIIIRDYFLGERWRRVLGGENIDASGKPGVADLLIWLFLLLGLFCFFGGFLGQAYVATKII